MDDHFAIETEQHLSVESPITTITRMSVDDPPEFVLKVDVIHDETHHAWRQEIRFDSNQMVELTQLMVYACGQIDLEWEGEIDD